MAYSPSQLRDTKGKWVRMGRGDLEELMHAAVRPRAEDIAAVNGKGGDHKHIALIQRDLRNKALGKHKRVVPVVHVKVENLDGMVKVHVNRKGSPRVEVHKIPKRKVYGNIEHSVGLGAPHPQDIFNAENFSALNPKTPRGQDTEGIRAGLDRALPTALPSQLRRKLGLTNVAKKAADEGRRQRRKGKVVAPNTRDNSNKAKFRELEALRAKKLITKAQEDRVKALLMHSPNSERDLGSNLRLIVQKKQLLDADWKALAEVLAIVVNGEPPMQRQGDKNEAAAKRQEAAAKRQEFVKHGPRDDVERAMLEEDIKSWKNHGGGMNETIMAKMASGLKVFIKPISGADDGGKRYTRVEIPRGRDAEHEYVASRIAQALEVEDAPRVVIRDVGDIGYSGGGKASVQNSVGERSMHEVNFFEDCYRLSLFRIALFDMVIGNLDRHKGNLRAQGGSHIIPIDNGLAFPKQEGRGVSNAVVAEMFWNKLLTPSEERLLEKLRDNDQLWSDAAKHLQPAQISLTKKRIDRMLSTGRMLNGHAELTGRW